jgi:hypothetical protein
MIEKALMKSIEGIFANCHKYSLFTGKKHTRNLYFYGSLGYKAVGEKIVKEKLTFVYLDKANTKQI